MKQTIMKNTNYYNMSALIVLFVVLNTQMPFSATSSTTLATDESTLLTLKAQITSDPSQILARNWTNSSSVCTWIGVTCNSRHQRVSALNISDMELSGTIPPQIGNLSFLISLDLSYNLFSGDLPQELSLLHRLEVITLGNNSFTGSIPYNISNLSNLEILDFSSNSLQGGIPEEFGRLRSLRVLRMEDNDLSGSIPSAVFNLSTLELLALNDNNLNGGLPIDMCRNNPFLERIHLSYNQLSGQIPSSISGCSQLQLLYLSHNSFSGQIPREIGKITSLQLLYLTNNNLTGVIPQEIGNLHNLERFSIGTNQITGSLQLNIFNSSSLQILVLESNKLTGSIPREIGNFTNLIYLSLSNNYLAGLLPREIGELYQLENLVLESNSFNGSIPPKIFNISTLQTLSFFENDLSGSLPTNVGYGLPVLEELFLNENSLTGTIPDSISNCSNLKSLILSSNKFTGFIPHSLGDLRLLERLYLSNNNLSLESSSSELSFITPLTKCRFLNQLTVSENPIEGIIPASVGNLSTTLNYFFAYDCKIKGNIPDEIGNLTNLVRLSLFGNELTGIPPTIKDLHKLQGLFLLNNKFTGSIPSTLCDLQSLDQIYLGLNQFSGPIPECLGNLTSLTVLSLYSNMLTSSIPSSLWRLKDLSELDLSSNSLSGFLPPEISTLMAAISIDLSMNQLARDIPSTIGDLKNLANLSLAHNRLEGSIPESVGSMISLVRLDLSHNNLSGSIPKSLEKLQYLDYFNVSFNALRGEIPSGGPFGNFSMESFNANAALCGPPRFEVPLCQTVSKHKSRKKKMLRALLILTGVVSLIIIVISLTFIVTRYRRKDKLVSGIGVLEANIPERISYYELLQATEQFSESNLLGVGGYGSVYKGVMRDGKFLAVKVFNLQLQSAFKSFDIECEVLRNLRHRNLTKVISSCSNEDFKALVLEYMPNGSLEKWLYSHNNFLDLMQRLNIMIDVASALEYLHHGYLTPIVHCDLKPSNVLLDEEMTAHVSDFGIAKMLGEGESISHTNTLATMGYIAPEYGLEGLVSTRCDVYSYGIMLMEIFTRKRPSDDMFAGDLSLKSWVGRSLTSQVIDANLLNPDEKHFDNNLQCVSSLMKLALKCSAETPVDRINMKEALSEKSGYRCQLIESRRTTI